MPTPHVEGGTPRRRDREDDHENPIKILNFNLAKPIRPPKMIA